MNPFSKCVVRPYFSSNVFNRVRHDLDSLITFDAQLLAHLLNSYGLDFDALCRWGNFDIFTTDDFVCILNGIDGIGWLNQNGYLYLELKSKPVDLHLDGDTLYLDYNYCGSVIKRKLYITPDLTYHLMPCDEYKY